MERVKLSSLIVSKKIKADSLKGYKALPALGVTKHLGIAETSHKRSKDLSNYIVITENDFAYNPYRVNIGSIGLTPKGITGLVSPAYVVFATNKKLLPEILLAFLKSEEGLFQISQHTKGTVRKALRFQDLQKIDFPYMPMAEQKKIAARIAKIKTAENKLCAEIANQRKLLAGLRRRILQDAIEGKLTTDWRKGSSRNYESAEVLLKRISQEKSLGDFLTQKKREVAINPNTEYSLVTISNKGIVHLREKKRGAEIAAKKAYLAKAGDFIYSRLAAHTGAFGIVGEELDNALVTGEMPCFEIDKRQVLPDVLTNMLKMPAIVWQLKQFTQGMGRVRIKEQMMLSLSLLLPDISEQKKIASCIAEINSLREEISRSEELAKRLMQATLKEAFTPPQA